MKTVYVKVIPSVVEEYRKEGLVKAEVVFKKFLLTNKGLNDLLPILKSQGFHFKPKEDGIEIFLKEEKKLIGSVKEIENLIKPDMFPKKKISITLNPDVLEKVNEYGRFFRGGRCRLIRIALEQYFKNNEEDLKKLSEKI